jgi:hypothetical protein
LIPSKPIAQLAAERAFRMLDKDKVSKKLDDFEADQKTNQSATNLNKAMKRDSAHRTSTIGRSVNMIIK